MSPREYKLAAYWSGTRELYHLVDDSGASEDFSAANPGRARELSGLLASRRAHIGLQPEPGTEQRLAEGSEPFADA